MPRGDNQHRFTCSRCGIQKSRDERCPIVGICNPCCDEKGRQYYGQPRSYCAATCGHCRVTFPRHGNDGCAVCGGHKQCGPEGARVSRCVCRECAECGQLFQSPACPSGLCGDCHPSDACRICDYCGDHGLPARIQECCRYCTSCHRDRCSAHRIQYFEHGKLEFLGTSRVSKRLNKGGKSKHLEIVRTPLTAAERLKNHRRNPSQRHVGLEIEVSKYSDARPVMEAVKKWKGSIVSDGSVANGFEINTQPVNGDMLEDMVKELSEAIRKKGGGLADHKAGLHVHVDCADLSREDMRKFLILYGKVEDALYGIIDPARKTGTFSKPMGGDGLVKMFSDPEDTKNKILLQTYGIWSGRAAKEVGAGAKSAPGMDRYFGLNMHSWFHRGTIEFRHHHGTTKWDRMLYWSMLLAAMVDRAVALPAKDILAHRTGLNGLLDIATTEKLREWIKIRWDYFNKKEKKDGKPQVRNRSTAGQTDDRPF